MHFSPNKNPIKLPLNFRISIDMRLIFFAILFLITPQLYAESTEGSTWMEKLPYYPPMSRSISLDDEETCNIQGTLGMAALTNAKHGSITESQVEKWYTYLHFNVDQSSNNKFLDLDHAIVILAWTVMTKYPDVSPTDYGEFVYESCITTKPPINKTRI